MTTDVAQLVQLAPSALDDMEREARSELLDHTHAADREAMKALLDNPRRSFDVIAGDDKDPELARLLRVILAIRTARGQQREGRSGVTFSRAPEKESAIVRLAMVTAMSPADAASRAIVRREPGDNGRPLLILPESATPGDMERGLRLAVASIKRYGREPLQVAVMRLRKAPTAKDATRRGKDMLEHIKSTASTRTAGVGQARYAVIAVR